MSGELTVGKRYAKALFELAKDNNQLEQIEEELKAVTAALSDEQTQSFLRHPSISEEQKLAVLNKALEGKVSEIVLDTLRLLIERRRAFVVEALSSHYARLVDDYRGRATAIVYTPLPLSDSDKAKVAEYYGKLTGKQIQVHNEINTELLGGMQVRIGDRLYDGSLSGKLAELRKQLA